LGKFTILPFNTGNAVLCKLPNAPLVYQLGFVAFVFGFRSEFLGTPSNLL
jgi:hypothetical protein